MGRRENYIDTIHHRKPESLIIDFGGCPLSSMEGRSEDKLLEFLGYGKKESESLLFGKTKKLDERILKEFHIDTRAVGEIMTPSDSQFLKISDEEYIDEWGIRRKYTGLYWDAVDAPLKGATVEDLRNYRFPNPDSIDMRILEEHALRAKELYEKTDYVICGEHPVYGVFELGCWLCGFDDFLMKMAIDPEFVEELFEIIWQYQKRVIELYYGKLGAYIHYTSSGDDFATQNGPFISPGMFREFIAPYLKKRISYTRQFTDAQFLHHSCGSVYMLIDDLIDCGVEILNPIQPKAANMSPEILKREFGDRIVFHGGIDTQELLPFADAEEIREEVARVVEIMNQNGGYILAAAHNIQEDVDPKKLAVMLEAANKMR